jgi:hypothetical protein
MRKSAKAEARSHLELGLLQNYAHGAGISSQIHIDIPWQMRPGHLSIADLVGASIGAHQAAYTRV